MYTKQQLVNACLRSIGNDQVSTLANADADTDMAITTVEEAIVEVLSTGWWFNTESNWSLSLNSNGEVEVPKTVLAFHTSGLTRNVELIKRSGKFYNKTDHTFDLSDISDNEGRIHFTFVVLLDIADIPTVAQQYIRQRARVQYMLDMEADANKIEKAASEELRFLVTLERQQRRNRKDNVYQHAGVRNVLSGMQSQNGIGGLSSGGHYLNPLGGTQDG